MNNRQKILELAEHWKSLAERWRAFFVKDTSFSDFQSGKATAYFKCAEQLLATLHSAEPAGDVEAGMLPDEFDAISDQWYTLCERASYATKIMISGELAEAIVKCVSRLAQPQRQGRAVDWKAWAESFGVDPTRRVIEMLEAVHRTEQPASAAKYRIDVGGTPSGDAPESWDAVDAALLHWYGHAVNFTQGERQRFFDAVRKYFTLGHSANAAAMNWRSAAIRAYGYLWHASESGDVPAGEWSLLPDRAIHDARLILRDALSITERGEGIQFVRSTLAAAPDRSEVP